MLHFNVRSVSLIDIKFNPKTSHKTVKYLHSTISLLMQLLTVVVDDKVR